MHYIYFCCLASSTILNRSGYFNFFFFLITWVIRTEASFLTSVSASPKPGSSHVLPTPSTSLVRYFNYFVSNILNSPTPQVSLSHLQNASNSPPPFLSCSLITQCLHTKVSCFVDSMHILFIKQLPERNSERNLSPIFSWMGCSSFHCFCLSVYS